MWNNAEHLEAYLAIPSMGAVLHTLNIRLFPEQLTYIAEHADDKVVLVDDSLVPLLESCSRRSRPSSTSSWQDPKLVQQILIRSARAASRCTSTRICSPRPTRPSTGWLPTRTMPPPCATPAGPRANPGRGLLAPLGIPALDGRVRGQRRRAHLARPGAADRPDVPRQRLGPPYAALLAGSSLLMPDRWLQAEPITRFMVASRPTVPEPCRRSGTTCWATRPVSSRPAHRRTSRRSGSSCGGSAVPVSLQKALSERHGIEMRQAWG